MSGESTPPVIFLAFANERDPQVPERYLRNLPEEARRLQQVLEAAEGEHLCEVVVQQNATLDDIFRVFQQRRYRNQVAIFHYGGHANSYQLLFETREGKPTAADAAGLANFLRQQTGLQLVFLNGCSTQQQALGLCDAGVSAVIATSQAIDDEVATDFSARFYQALAGGAAIGTAFKEAEAAVQTARGGPTRHLYAVADEGKLLVDGSPWDLYLREGADEATDWNLPAAADNPLFGLPPLPELDLPESPYRHLNWYQREDAEVFFGRGREIRDLYEGVTTPRTAPILLFYGQSGVGKSSLLAAGLLPRLEQDYAIRYVRRDQAQGLLGTLVEAMGTGDPGDLAVGWRATEEREGKSLIVVLDQVEEVYTRPNEGMADELAAFLEGLRTVFGDPQHRPQGKLILGFRKEWLAELEKEMAERKLPRTKVFLQRLDKRGISEVVTGPTRSERLQRQYGLAVAEELPVEIADDLLADRGSAVAPTLGILLSKMWERARERDYDQPRFDEDLYRDLRKEGLGLGDFLEQQLNALCAEQAEVVDSGLALDLLAYHTTPLGTAEQRATAELEETYRHREEVLPGLVQECHDLYLLVDPVKDQPARPAASRLAHDTLAPLVRARFDESDLPGQRARRILESRAVEWECEEKDGPITRGTALDEADLAVVEQGAVGMRAWTGAEERLVDVSRRERDRRKRNRRLVRTTLIGLGCLVVIGAALAVWQWRTAERRQAEAEVQARVALARQLAAQATSSFERRQGIDLSLLLAVQAITGTLDAELPTVLEANIALRGVLAESPQAILRHENNVRHVSFNLDGTLLVTLLQNDAHVWDVARGIELDVLSHGAWIWGAIFSPDGTRLATGSDDGTARLWDAATGKVAILDHGAAIKQVIFSPDGTRLVTGSEDGKVHLWDVSEVVSTSGASGQPTVLEHGSPVQHIAYSPDGTRLATGSQDGFARLWDVAGLPNTGSSVHQLAALEHGKEVLSIAFSPNGTELATSSADSTARVWDAATGQPLAVLDHDAPVEKAIFSPDGTRLATSSADDMARLWDVSKVLLTGGRGQELAILPHRGKVWGIAFSPGGTRLATASADSTAYLVDTASGEELAILRHGGPVRDVTFSLDGTWLVTSSEDGTAYLWDAATGRQLAVRRHEDFVRDAAFSPDGTLLATASNDDTARLWQTTSGVEPKDLHHEDQVFEISFSPDGALLASGSNDGTARLWDTATGEELAILHHDGPVPYAVFSPDGTQLATGSTDGTARLWDVAGALKTGGTREAAIDLPHGAPVTELAFSPDGAYLATACSDGKTRLWDTVIGDELAVLDHEGPVRYVTFSLDGTWLATSSEDGTARVWHVATALERGEIGQKPAATLHHGSKTETVRVSSATFSPDGRFLATAGYDGTVRLWDLISKEEVASLHHQEQQRVWRAAFSSDGRLMATYSRDKTARLWDVSTVVNTGGTDGEVAILRHEGPVMGLSFSPNGDWLATASAGRDGTARVWDVATGEEVIRLLHRHPVWWVAFSPKQQLLATSSQDGVARLWRLDTKELAAVACDIVNRNLTYAEWTEFQGDEQYRATCYKMPLDPAELLLAAEASALEGDREHAEAAFSQAVALVTETYDSALSNSVCRSGSIDGFAEVVVPACEHVVALAPDDHRMRDSRGLARALTGDYLGAIADFQYFVDQSSDQALVAKRVAWIAELQGGRNPFDEETLEALRNE